jgi:DNA polymerase elongation subunit (family B)
MSEEVMFTNCEYDYRSNKIHLWEIIDGKKTHKTFDYQHEYYVSDPNGEFSDMYGNKMSKRVCKKKKDVDDKLNYLPSDAMVAESDINETTKFLHSRYNFKNLKPNPDYVQTMTFDIEVEVADEFPKPEEVKYAVNAITAYFSRTNKLVVLTYSGSGQKYTNRMTAQEIYDGTKGYRDKSGNRIYDGIKIDAYDLYEFADEKQMLEAFITITRKQSVDIITGWNIDTFDIPYIVNRLKALGSNAWKRLSPINKVKENKFGGYDISGISVLDYIKVYRDRFTFDNKGSYSLNNICDIELKKSKLEYEGTLSTLWKEDWDTFISYNIVDTLRVVELERKMKFLQLIIIMTHESLIQYVGILSTLPDHLGLLMRYLAKHGMVLNNRENNEKSSFPGAYVFAAPGKYRYVISFDVTSLYPTIIIRDNIGQETLVQDPETEVWIEIIKNKQRFMIRGHVMMQVIRNNIEMRVRADEMLETDIIRV